MNAEAVETTPAEAPEGEQPLRLSCGHLLSAVVTTPEGTSYCGACAALAEIVQAEAEEAEQPDSEEDESLHLDEEAAEVDEGEEPRQDSDDEDGAAPGLALAQPFHSTRSDVQGRRGCWAVSVKTGKACGAPSVRGQDYCSAHSGLGVSGAPAEYAPKALEAKKRNAAIRSEVRMMYGSSRQGGARQVLRAAVEREAIGLAGRAIGAALDESADPIKAGHLALKVIEAAEPSDSATLTLSGELDAEAIDQMSLSQLIAFAGANGIDLPATSPETLTAPS